VTRPDRTVPGTDVRLVEAAETGDMLEVILVVRGKVRARGVGRWRIRTVEGHVLTFPAGSVVAATPVVQPPRRARR
jgi:hypothetical protein